MVRRITACAVGVLLALCVPIGLAAQGGGVQAQIQAALRAFTRSANTWTGSQTFQNVTVNGTCTGCGGGGGISFADLASPPANTALGSDSAPFQNLRLGGTTHPDFSYTHLVIGDDTNSYATARIAPLRNGTDFVGGEWGIGYTQAGALTVTAIFYSESYPSGDGDFGIGVNGPFAYPFIGVINAGDVAIGNANSDSTPAIIAGNLIVRGASGNVEIKGTATATDFIVSGSRLKSDTTNTHTGGLAVYDVDGAAYKDFLVWTNANAPAVVLSTPAGGTFSGDFSSLTIASAAVATQTYVNAQGLLQGTTGSIGGGLLAAVGSCATGTATVTGAVVGKPVFFSTSDGTAANSLVSVYASVTATNTVTLQECALAAVTPTAKTWNVAVAQ